MASQKMVSTIKKLTNTEIIEENRKAVSVRGSEIGKVRTLKSQQQLTYRKDDSPKHLTLCSISAPVGELLATRLLDCVGHERFKLIKLESEYLPARSRK